MPGVRDLLERFRPVGTPGPAGPVGVPADSRADLEAELAPVLAGLQETERQCEQMRAAGRARAERLITHARTRAEATVADAGLRAANERADAVADQHQRQQVQAEGELSRATQEAHRIARLAAERIPALAARVVDAARAELGLGGPL